jgi:hypothetical protein
MPMPRLVIEFRGGEPCLTAFESVLSRSTPPRAVPGRYLLDPTPDIWYTFWRWIAIEPIGVGMEAMIMNRSDGKLAAAPARGATVRPESAQDFRSTSQGGLVPPPHLTLQRSLNDRDESDPVRCTAELVQRGRLILDVSAADLEAAEATFGAFHPTTWHFRNSLNEAQRSWERLKAELGAKTVAVALEKPPLTTLALDETSNGQPGVVLILIAGQTYRPQRVLGTDLAPVQWRLTRLRPPLENGPYYVCRLANGSTQCDCADWTYRIAETNDALAARCKHLVALAALGWI